MEGGIYAGTHLVGGMTADYWARDPKRLGFVLARYKFVAKMFSGYRRVLEVGCADGFGSHVVRQHVGRLVAIDVDGQSILEAEMFNNEERPVEFRQANVLTDALAKFDGVYALDVLEHIAPWENERLFLEAMRAVAPVAIIGSPSAESQAYASELSKAGHVNCKTEAELKATMENYWKHIFVFGMNDETLHTGFGPMCHYRLALCVA